ncbi:MAG: ElyC/SanA/YdcF family protein [Clostridia bacterium]|nr:ElyC/SanA/YdcF family protein [Clostridia bacterium]
MKNIVKKVFKLVIIIILVVAIVGFFINIHMVNYSKKYIAVDINDLYQSMQKGSQAVIVPGAYVYDNGQPCPMLADRLLSGLAVYNSGMADKMLLSGDHGTRGYDEVNAMKSFVFAADVPAGDVFLDHAGFSTYDSIIRAGKIFDVETAVISTQEYHLTRAVYIARHSGIEAYGIRADLRRYPRSEMARYTLREWFARIKDFIYVRILKPDPVFLGDKIPITGSSSPSFDKPEDLN